MKSLIVGSHGMIGTALSKQLPTAVKTVRLSPVPIRFEKYADITKYDSLFQIFADWRPDLVFLSAYNTDVDKCENIETNVTNVRGAVNVLRLCEQFEAKLIFFSSSYVFDGKSKYPYDIADETHPINNYGMQKDAVERLILTSYAKYVIVRTVGVFGPDKNRKNFVDRVIDSVSSGQKVYAPTDQFMNPVFSNDLARITVQLAKKEQGLFHVAGNDCVSKYEFAQEVARYFNLENLIVPVTSKEMKQKAVRPRMGCLDSHELGVVGIEIPDFISSLNGYIDSEMIA